MSEMRDRRDMRNDEVQGETRTEPQMGTRPDPQTDTRSDPQMETRAQRETRMDPQMERRTERRGDQRTDTRMEPRSDQRAEARTDGRMQAARPETQMEMWPEMAEFGRRFEAIESEFIDDPSAAVRKAERLMEEAIDRLARSMRERMQSMHKDVDGKNGDTETLRQAMVRYRAWMISMGGRRAA